MSPSSRRRAQAHRPGPGEDGCAACAPSPQTREGHGRTAPGVPGARPGNGGGSGAARGRARVRSRAGRGSARTEACGGEAGGRGGRRRLRDLINGIGTSLRSGLLAGTRGRHAAHAKVALDDRRWPRPTISSSSSRATPSARGSAARRSTRAFRRPPGASPRRRALYARAPRRPSGTTRSTSGSVFRQPPLPVRETGLRIPKRRRPPIRLPGISTFRRKGSHADNDDLRMNQNETLNRKLALWASDGGKSREAAAYLGSTRTARATLVRHPGAGGAPTAARSLWTGSG